MERRSYPSDESRHGAPKHDADAVDSVLAGYQGYLVADAHVVYDHLYQSG